MTRPHRTPPLRPSVLLDAWQLFWFRPEPAYPLGLIRIAFGVLVVAWGISLPDLHQLFGTDGVAPRQPENPYAWGLFELWTSDQALLIGRIALVVAGIAMAVGWHCRLAALIVFVLILSFQDRNPAVFNSGDAVILVEALLLALSPCGAALSIDQRRTAGSFWSAQMRAPWTLRLMQLQLSVIYFASVRTKMSGDTWPRGTAVSYALQLEDMLLLHPPHWVTASAILMNVASWGTLTLELALGILVWNRRLRPWLLAAGVLMHTTIMLTINVGFFTPAMFVLYLAFLSPETVRRLPANVRRLAGRLRLRPQRRKPVVEVTNPTEPAERPSPTSVFRPLTAETQAGRPRESLLIASSSTRVGGNGGTASK